MLAPGSSSRPPIRRLGRRFQDAPSRPDHRNGITGGGQLEDLKPGPLGGPLLFPAAAGWINGAAELSRKKTVERFGGPAPA